jgi:phenylacetate-CoA ligase
MIHTASILLACRGRSRWPTEQLRRLQEQRLRALVRDAYERVPFYRRRFEEVGLTPDAVRTLEDLPKIPTTTKDMLRKTPMADLVATGADPARLDVVRTSGSTGSPLRILRGPREVAWHRAAGLRIFRELGFRWTDRTLEIRALAGPTYLVQSLGLAPKRWVSILDTPEAQMQALLDYRPHVVCAGAGTLHDLALTILAARVTPPVPRLIISDSEPLRPDTRALVRRALGVAPLDVYGLVELSNFAWQCEERSGLHVSADTHLVEVLADDGPAAPGTPGRIVCTDLLARTMPLLRYETGDRAALASGRCPCGRTLPMLTDLVGREGDVIALPDGRRLYWPYFHETFARYEGLERYQVIQDDPSGLRVRVLAPAERYPGLVRGLQAELSRQIPAAMRVAFEPWGQGTADPSAKFRPVLSMVRSTSGARR